MDGIMRQRIPADGGYVLAGVRAPAGLVAGLADGSGDGEGLIEVDIAIAEGRIVDVARCGRDEGRGPAGAETALPEAAVRLEAGGRVVWPCPVDVHTHLDKAHIWPRAANPDGSFMAALETVEADRSRHWRAADLEARMEFGLRCALAHGTAAIRSHLDSDPPQHRTTWPVFAALRERWAGRIAFHGVSICMMDCYRGREGAALADLVAECGGLLGGFPLMGPELAADLRRLFALAGERGLDVDLHVDETLDPGSRVLEAVAEAVLETGFAGRVTCGHGCSLATQEEDQVRRSLDRVARAGIAIVSLPMCNLYLQDRSPGRTPRWRGVTLLHEIRARGIPLAVASDNCRDPFFAYGDHDMHEVFREAVRIGHLDHPLEGWVETVTATPARIMGLEQAGRIVAGGPADLVLFKGRSLNEVLARPETGRLVLRRGRALDTTLPDYAELDGLFGPAAGRVKQGSGG